VDRYEIEHPVVNDAQHKIWDKFEVASWPTLRVIAELEGDDLAEVHYNLGNVFVMRRQFDQAIRHYRDAIRIKPAYAEAYNNLGYAYMGEDSLDQAIAAFQTLLQKNPNHLVGLYRLSDAYRMKGRYQDAVPPLQQILALDSAEAWAKYRLGVLYRLVGDDAGAANYFRMFVADAEQWVKEKPGDLRNSIFLGLGTSRLGNLEEGWRLGTRGLRPDSTPHVEFAQLLAIQHRHGEAVDQLEQALQRGFTDYIWLKMHPDLWDLRNEQRFQQLLRRVIKG